MMKIKYKQKTKDPPSGQTPAPKPRLDEMKTLNLIDALDEQSKNVLNALVCSVIKTQKENDNDKMQLIKHRKQLIQAEKKLEDERLAYEK